MNILEAKEEIRRTCAAYTAKTPEGLYRIPVRHQRPVYLIGPPGIGKTAILSQVAEELGLGLVSCTMTHHTRQSALGLPRIETETFEGNEVSVTRYTMSEIVAEVYRQRERTGRKEGILFLDEINCVSETLLPAVLQLLQYKSFGTHKLPEGWILVAAGNPPRYNSSAKALDTATLDRMKVLPIEPSLGAWQTYAADTDLHPAILSYLQLNPGDFYQTGAASGGHSFVTARGWEDLSEMLCVLESLEEEVTPGFIASYLQKEEVAERFSLYYHLHRLFTKEHRSEKDLSYLQDRSFEEQTAVLLFTASEYTERARALSAKKDRIRSLENLFRQVFAQKDSASDASLFSRREQFFEVLSRRKLALSIQKDAGLCSPAAEVQENLLLKEAVTLWDRLTVESGDVPAPTTVTEALSAEALSLKCEMDGLMTELRNTTETVLSALPDSDPAFLYASALLRATHLRALLSADPALLTTLKAASALPSLKG